MLTRFDSLIYIIKIVDRLLRYMFALRTLLVWVLPDLYEYDKIKYNIFRRKDYVNLFGKTWKYFNIKKKNNNNSIWILNNKSYELNTIYYDDTKCAINIF